MQRYARLARRLKSEREWMRREFGNLVKRADAVALRWRKRVRDLEVVNKTMRGELTVKGGRERSQTGDKGSRCNRG